MSLIYVPPTEQIGLVKAKFLSSILYEAFYETMANSLAFESKAMDQILV